MFKSVLVAVDGSEHSMRAVDMAADLSKNFGTRLLILHVYKHVTPMESTHSLVRSRQSLAPSDDALRDFAKEVVQEAKQRAIKKGAQHVDTFIKKGQPARAIVDFAKEKGVDAIIMGNRGWGDIGAFLLGSVSHKVSNLAGCTCITVK
jgi:nucleotide-binding universal stress UspA family protein